MLTIAKKKKINLNDLLIPALLVLFLAGTIIERHWIKPLALAIAGYFLILIYAQRIILVTNSKKILFAFTLLFLMGVYAFVYSPVLVPDTVALAFSFPLLILLTVALAKSDRICIFSALILIPLAIIVFSPGLTKIFSLTRSFGTIGRGSEDILRGFSVHYINYSMRCVMAFFISTGLCLVSKHSIKRILTGFLAITACVGCVTAGSRGGVIALLCGSISFLVLLRGKVCGRKVLQFKYVLLIIGVAIFVIPWKSIYGTFTRTYLTTGVAENRWRLYMHGLEMFYHNFLFGIGWGGYKYLTTEAVHSNWLRTFIELGVIGGITEVILWAMFFRIAFAARKMAETLMDRGLAVFMVAWISIMVAFCVWQAYENVGLLAGTRIYYLCFGVVSAAYLSMKTQVANKMTG